MECGSNDSGKADAARAFADQRHAVLVEAKRAQKIFDVVVGAASRESRATSVRASSAPIDEARIAGGDRQDVRVRVRARRRLDAPVGGLVELAEAHVRERAAREHAEQQRIERAQLARVVGRFDRRARVA